MERALSQAPPPPLQHRLQRSSSGRLRCSRFDVYGCPVYCVPPLLREHMRRQHTFTGLHGTPEYAAPEVAIWYWHEFGQQLAEPPPPYGFAADAWSVGMCLHVMLCGSFPFETPSSEARNGDVEQMLRCAPLCASDIRNSRQSYRGTGSLFWEHGGTRVGNLE